MLEELNLTEEQLTGVQKYVQAENDKLRTKYTKQIKDLESKVPKEPTQEELDFEKKVKDLEDKEKELNKKELLANAKDLLKSEGLDTQLADFIQLEGVEDLKTHIENLTKVLVDKNIYVPNKGKEKANGNITKEQFGKMGYAERCNLFETNKELYDILSK